MTLGFYVPLICTTESKPMATKLRKLNCSLLTIARAFFAETNL
jgi:hypothetical protein